MPKFLTTKGVAHKIEDIIIEARSHIYLVSPFLQISKTFFERLRDAEKRGVEITIIYGKDELKPNEKNTLAELATLKTYFFENLHAKCYFNESELIITSMNMYAFSEANNREMGVLISKVEDSEIYNKAREESLSILESSELTPFKKTERVITKKVKKGDVNSKKPKRGYCIRCEERIPYRIDKPYCIDCFSSWSKYENEDYEEECCHACGEYENTTILKPVCYKCYKKYEK